MNHYKILNSTKKYATSYLNELPDRRVFPNKKSLKLLEKLAVSLPAKPTDPEKVIETLHKIGSVNTVASNGGRYFGFIFGGALPASLAANWLAAAWDQNAAFKVSSPIAAQLEKVAGGWLKQLLRLPEQSAVGFVTGTTMANFCGVLAARNTIYKRMGYDLKANGMATAPEIRVVVGQEVHASMQRALLLAGFGLEKLIRVPVDGQGRIIAEKMPALDATTLVCVQAGNVNTGALDPIKEICLAANIAGAWVHVDAAFGLWAAVSPSRAHLTEGCELADSWAVDLHKWLNVPYDSGVAICKDPKTLQDALSVSAAYLPDSNDPDPLSYTPEMSRRARGTEVWAAIYSLGSKGVTEMVERCCELAQRFAANLKAAGFEILNEVILNQVLVSFGDAEQTLAIIKEVQEEGTCWAGSTVWQGRTAMRISVSSWMTTKKDVDLSSEAIIRVASSLRMP